MGGGGGGVQSLSQTQSSSRAQHSTDNCERNQSIKRAYLLPGKFPLRLHRARAELCALSNMHCEEGRRSTLNKKHHRSCLKLLWEMAWHGMAWHGKAWHGMVRHGMAW